MSYDWLIELLKAAVVNRPGQATYAGVPESPPWFDDDLIVTLSRNRDGLTKSYPPLKWLQGRVRDAMEEALRHPQVMDLILDALPTPEAPPPVHITWNTDEDDEDANYDLNQGAHRKWEERFHTPAVRLWLLWKNWASLVGTPPQTWPPSPDYPGLRQDKTQPNRFMTALKTTYFRGRQARELAGHIFTPQAFGLHLCQQENPPVVDSICAGLTWLRQELETRAELAKHKTDKVRLYVEDIDNFVLVRDVKPSMVANFLKDGWMNLAENAVKMALEQILYIPFHRNDSPAELDDIYTANVIVSGRPLATAFMLKGPGIGMKEMDIKHCGSKGNQLVRLFDAPADLFVIQFIGRIAETVVKDVEGKVTARRAHGKPAQFLIMEGQDTARVLYAYGKLKSK